jgi:hypothetical protein
MNIPLVQKRIDDCHVPGAKGASELLHRALHLGARVVRETRVVPRRRRAATTAEERQHHRQEEGATAGDSMIH